MFNGNRIKQVREIKGWTQKELAKRIGVKQSAISQIESGILQASEEIVQRVVLQTSFPLSFFKQSHNIDFPKGSLLYRGRASMTSHECNKALQHARILFEIIKHMEKTLVPIKSNVPRIEEAPILCARKIRSLFSLSPDTPIDNLIHIFEKNGIIVLALPIKLEKIDAFSAWVDNITRRPVIAISKNVIHGDRLRFSLAHELGHLVMHQSMTGATNLIERDANIFAGEFLVPSEALEMELLKPVTISNLIPLKVRWKVSLQCLIRRAYEINKINLNQFQYLNIQISRLGYKTDEPVKISTEKPRLMGQMAEIKYGIPINYNKLAFDMNLPTQIVRDILESHAIKAYQWEEKRNGKIVSFPGNKKQSL